MTRTKTKKRKRRGVFSMVLGLLLIASSAALAAYNMQEESRAAAAAEDALVKLQKLRDENNTSKTEADAGKESEEDIPDRFIDPNMPMPTITIDGYRYIGTISIEPLELELPVMEEWDYTRMKIAPCRYSGSAYLDDLVICAHNYAQYFGSIKDLQEHDEIIFTDAVGNVFRYEVAETELLKPTAVEYMTSGDWDLTLFTCNYSGRARVTVRCNRIEE